MTWYVSEREKRAQMIQTGAMVRGKMVHEWMSEFANTEAIWIAENSIARNRQPLPKPVVSDYAPWIAFGDWSDERGPRVSRMMALAGVSK